MNITPLAHRLRSENIIKSTDSIDLNVWNASATEAIYTRPGQRKLILRIVINRCGG